MNQQLIESILHKVIARLHELKSANIPVELSARHVHLSHQHKALLLKGHLTEDKPLSQPGQFLAKERIRLIGPKGVIDNVAVLGPARSKTQVEISLTDARYLGVKAPIRHSGDIAGTPGIILASPNGIVGIEEGVIIAGRHIHLPTVYARQLDLKDQDKVSVRVDSARPLIMEDVLVRVDDNCGLAMHIDFDEGNACGCQDGCVGTIIQSSGEKLHGT